jgi:concanavalin A-like lectin/glucanase superfamily protein
MPFSLRPRAALRDRPLVNLLGNRSTLSISADPASQAAIASQAAFGFAGATFALSAWVKLAGTTDTDIIGIRAASCGTLGWKLGQDAVHGLNISGGGGMLGFGTSLPAATWTHVAFSYDATAGQLVMYVNGQQVASSAYAPRNGLPATPLTIGHVGGCAGGAVLVDELRIFSRTLTASEVAALGAVPPAPTLTVTAPSARLEVLTWTAVANASRYFVYRGTAPGNESFLISVAGSSLSFDAQQLTPLTRYSWFVRAEVNSLDSPASNEVVLSTPDLLPAPGDVTATAQPPSSAALSWSAVTGAAGYQVYQSSNGGAFVLVQSVDDSTTSLAIGGLGSGTYQFELAALDSGRNTGHRSAPVTVTLP